MEERALFLSCFGKYEYPFPDGKGRSFLIVIIPLYIFLLHPPKHYWIGKCPQKLRISLLWFREIILRGMFFIANFAAEKKK